MPTITLPLEARMAELQAHARLLFFRRQ